jgi:hypothetical protein
MMSVIARMRRSIWSVATTLLVVAAPALAEKNYGPGVSDTEIKLGQTMPYSGAASSYGVIGKTQLAYCAEGFNSAIQLIKANARGFRNFTNYRARILFHCGKLDLAMG